MQCLDTAWTIGEVDATHGAEGEANRVEPPPEPNDGFRERREARGQRLLRTCPLGCPCGATTQTTTTKMSNGRHESAGVDSIDGQEMTRMAQLEFNEADVRKPLASARLVAKAGNGIWLEADGGGTSTTWRLAKGWR